MTSPGLAVWSIIALLWVHILSVIVWFGGSALMAFVIGPALGSTRSVSNAGVIAGIAGRSHRYYGIAGGLTIVSGLLLAWQTNHFGSPLLGIVIVLAIFLAFWGAMVTGRRADALGSASESDFPVAQRRMMQASAVELTVFLIALTLMILVRFGF